MTTEYVAGDVLRYTPASGSGRHDPWWCREGMAIVQQNGAILDTYWAMLSDAHRLTIEELATAELRFNIDDFDEIRSEEAWKTYADVDRRVITSQHKLQIRWFTRKGAEPDLATQIANARTALESAQYDVKDAERRRDRCEEDLDRLQDQLAAVTFEKAVSGVKS